jgi:hypothetical protein
MPARTKRFGNSLLALLAVGCVTKSKANAQARAACMEGQKEALAQKLQGPSVWIAGNVKTPLVPWTSDLTVTKAIIAADYLGTHDPSEIIFTRPGQPALRIRPQQLLEGQDMPLQPGDQIEIRP